LTHVNAAVDHAHFVAGKADFARPDAVVKIAKIGNGDTRVDGLARGAKQEKDGGIAHVRNLAHEVETRAPVFAGRFAEIVAKIAPLLGVVRDYEIRDDGKIEVAVVQEGRFPIDEPDTAAIEKHVFGLQVVVARDQIEIAARIDGCGASVELEKLCGFAFGQDFRRAEFLNESVDDVEEVAEGRRPGERRQGMDCAKDRGQANQGLRARKELRFDEVGDRNPVFDAGVPDARGKAGFGSCLHASELASGIGHRVGAGDDAQQIGLAANDDAKDESRAQPHRQLSDMLEFGEAERFLQGA
jgi:hypothetical protein